MKYKLTNYFNQTTARLILRACHEEDIPKYESFFVLNPSLPYLGIDLTLDKTANAKIWIENQLSRYEKIGLGHLAITDKSTSEFMGTAGIIPRLIDDKPYMEIAYSLKQEFWGKGFASEATQQLLKFGLAQELSKSYVSIIHVENFASKKVAINNGMKVFFNIQYLGMPVEVFEISI